MSAHGKPSFPAPCRAPRFRVKGDVTWSHYFDFKAPAVMPETRDIDASSGQRRNRFERPIERPDTATARGDLGEISVRTLTGCDPEDFQVMVPCDVEKEPDSYF